MFTWAENVSKINMCTLLYNKGQQQMNSRGILEMIWLKLYVWVLTIYKEEEIMHQKIKCTICSEKQSAR